MRGKAGSKLRIFTPGAELPFAAHPTVAAAFLLAALCEIEVTGAETTILFEEGVAPIAVRLVAENGAPVFAELAAARPSDFSPAPVTGVTLAELLSLDTADLGA